MRFPSWIAEIVGAWAIIQFLLIITDTIDDVNLYVISDLMQPYKSNFLKNKLSQSNEAALSMIDTPKIINDKLESNNTYQPKDF